MEVTGQEARFRAMFAEEAEGRLATLSELLLELERNGEDQELLSSVFREAHTLKGAAAVVGLADVLRVAHAMEEVLEGLRRGDPATPATVDALLGAVDGMREMVPAVLAGDDRADHADRLVADLHDPSPALALPPDPAPPPRPESVPGPPPVQPPPVQPPPVQPPPRRERRETVRLRVERLDELVRLVGEASAAALRVGRVVTDQLGGEPAGIPELHDLSRILESLQERTLQARMVPFGTIAEPLRRTARDLARSLGKAVELELRGQETELDRGVLEQVADPMLHLVRNAIDHGIELPEARLAAGKPRYGTVRVHAAQLGSEVVVTVADDGQGIDLARVRQQAGKAGDALDGVGDDEAIYAIFRSGLSTAATVSEVSGRGVGLDVVRASLASVRGRVEVLSEPGTGSEFRLSVPITLAVLPCLLVEAAGRRFGVPMHSVVSAEAAGWSEDHVEGQVVIRVRDTILPVSALAATLGVAGQGEAPASDSPAVVLASMTRRHAFRVDALLGQRNVVVKDLGRLLPRLALLAGASLEPDGSILLVLDVSGLVDRARWARSNGAGRPAPSPSPAVPAPAGPASVLVVDDTAVVRELERSILEEAGYRVRTAADGRLALAALADTTADLVVTDVEMPNCDGLELTRAIRAQPALTGLPVVVVTSRSSDADPRLADIPVVFVTSRVTTEDVVDGLRLGAHDYLRKPFEPSELLARVHAAVRNKALQDELRLRNAELELASRTDALTGLRNRRHLEEQLQRLAATGDPLSVLLCDIDRFKQVNDTRGHAAGDQVLRVVATRLGEVARPGDVPGRWGGEEFLVLLPGTGPAEAAAVGERTRLAIAAAPVPLAEGPLTVTTSVGVATGADDGWECLVRRADTGLYAAKESGRDRVAAGPPPEPAAGSRTFTPEGQDAARYR